jgi:hypothetical protein
MRSLVVWRLKQKAPAGMRPGTKKVRSDAGDATQRLIKTCLNGDWLLIDIGSFILAVAVVFAAVDDLELMASAYPVDR